MAHFLSRERTPTSPSPSPEPAEGAQNGGIADNARAMQTGDIAMQPPLLSQDSNRLGNIASGVMSSTAPSSAVVKSDEIARQVLEEKLRIGIDDLMQLAMCAGEVQPGDEDIVQMKV